MGRRARQFSLSDADRAELERISRSRTAAKQRVDRAKIILGCCEGEAQTALAQRLGTRPNTVSKWRSRFARLGLKGLEDAPRPGKPKRYVGIREQVLKTVEAPPPKGQARWDGLSLAKVVGAKKALYTMSCGRKAFSFNACAVGASAPIPILPQRRRTSSACVFSLRRVRRNRAFRRFHERRVTFKPRAARS